MAREVQATDVARCPGCGDRVETREGRFIPHEIEYDDGDYFLCDGSGHLASSP